MELIDEISLMKVSRSREPRKVLVDRFRANISLVLSHNQVSKHELDSQHLPTSPVMASTPHFAELSLAE